MNSVSYLFDMCVFPGGTQDNMEQTATKTIWACLLQVSINRNGCTTQEICLETPLAYDISDSRAAGEKVKKAK